MRLVVTFQHCTRPSDQRLRLELTFRDAMLDYEPNTERLFTWQKKRHFEYRQACLRGRWATAALMTDKERKQIKILIGFEL